MKTMLSSTPMRDRIELIEAALYRTLLTEGKRLDFMAKTYGQKIMARYEEEQIYGIPAAVENAIDREAAPSLRIEGEMTENFATMVPKIISYIVSHDPSRNQSYIQWMTMRWLKKEIKLEDIAMLGDNLETFERVKARLPVKDINAYKTPGALHDAVAPFMELAPVESNRAEERRIDRRMHQDDHAEILYNDVDYKVLTPLSPEAARHFGRNTQWCTTQTHMYDHYTQNGPLIIILEKKTNRRWQFHFDSQQFMDERDNQIDLKTFCAQHPKIIQILGDHRFANQVRKLGLGFFSKKTLAAMSSKDLAVGITQGSDLQMLPEGWKENPEMIAEIFRTNSGRSETAMSWMRSAGVTDETIREAVAYCGALIAQLPLDMIDDELLLLTQCGAGSKTSHIKPNISFVFANSPK